MLRRHVLRNRSLGTWLGGTTLLSGGCDVAGGVLGTVGFVLQLIGGAAGSPPPGWALPFLV